MNPGTIDFKQIHTTFIPVAVKLNFLGISTEGDIAHGILSPLCGKSPEYHQSPVTAENLPASLKKKLTHT